eukprot:5528776-Pyramimonas_sp.AAC.1
MLGSAVCCRRSEWHCRPSAGHCSGHPHFPSAFRGPSAFPAPSTAVPVLLVVLVFLLRPYSPPLPPAQLLPSCVRIIW